MFCARCDKPLRGQYDTIVNPGSTGSGGTIQVCKGWCKPKPCQSAPAGRR